MADDDLVSMALRRLSEAKVALVAKRVAADAVAAPLFEEADRIRSDAVEVHRKAIEAEGVDKAAAELAEAQREAERALRAYGHEVWAEVRCAAPARPDEALKDAPTAESSLKRAGVP